MQRPNVNITLESDSSYLDPSRASSALYSHSTGALLTPPSPVLQAASSPPSSPRRIVRDDTGKIYSFRTIEKEVKRKKKLYAEKPTKYTQVPTDNIRKCAVRFGIHGGEADLKMMIHKDLDCRNRDTWQDMVDINTLHSVAKCELNNQHYTSALRILNRVSYTHIFQIFVKQSKDFVVVQENELVLHSNLTSQWLLASDLLPLSIMLS